MISSNQPRKHTYQIVLCLRERQKQETLSTKVFCEKDLMKADQMK